MKKFFAILLVLALVATIGGLSVSLYNTKTSLSAAEADIAGMSFTEGDVIESSKNGGIVTASLNSWVYFEDDQFITVNKPVGTSLKSIFYQLYNKDLVYAFKGDLVKLKYTKQVILKNGNSEKVFFLVGDYYVSAVQG